MEIKVSKEFTVKLKNGKVVSSELGVTILTEPNYGADADGNRGVRADFIDDIFFLDNGFEYEYGGNKLSIEETIEAEDLLFDKADQYDWVDYARRMGD